METGYDEADGLRKENGIVFASVHRDTSDPHFVTAVHRFKTMEGAQGFVQAVSPIMRNIGVQAEPEMWFTEDVEQVYYS